MSEPDGKQVALARHYVDVDQPQRALDLLTDAAVDPEDPEVWALRSAAFLGLERYAEGAEAARSGLARDPDELELLDLLALNELERGRLADAEKALLAALEVAPAHPALLCHYALACARGGQFRKADGLLAEAARVDPESVDVLQVRAQVAYLAGDERRARREIDALLAADPENRVGHVLRGNLLADRNVYGAVRHFEEAARLDPSDEEVVRVTRHNRILTHPLQWPIYPIQRFGPFKVWGAYLVIFMLVASTGIGWLMAAVVVLYLFMVVYSWTAAPLARWWMGRKLR